MAAVAATLIRRAMVTALKNLFIVSIPFSCLDLQAFVEAHPGFPIRYRNYNPIPEFRLSDISYKVGL
jgi:hypothetical protein